MLPSRLISLAAAIALIAAAGTTATAGSGGTAPTTFAPATELPSDGAATAPGAVQGGGAAAPPQEEYVPVPATPAPADPGATTTVPAPTDTSGAVEPPAADEPGVEGPAVEEVPVGEEPAVEPVEAPTADETLAATGAPLVPAEVLPLAIDAEVEAPLIDISPAHVAAQPLETQVALAARPAQADGEGTEGEGDDQGGEQDDDDDEVIIPVDPDGTDGDDEGADDAPGDAGGPGFVPTADGGGPGLPRTGNDLAPPAITAIFLLLAGAALRRAVPVSGARAPA